MTEAPLTEENHGAPRRSPCRPTCATSRIHAAAPRHLLLDIIVIAVCAVICGANDWQQIATFGQQRATGWRRFLALAQRHPLPRYLRARLRRLEPARLPGALHPLDAGPGRRPAASSTSPSTARRCVARGGKPKASAPLHLVSAWATAKQLSLGQVAVDGKSNEITAIPELLDLLDLHGALVTIDAMGCQKAIAAEDHRPAAATTC